MYEALAERDKEKLKKWLRKDLNQAANILIPFLEDTGPEINT